MKGKGRIQSFGPFKENLNISDVSDSEIKHDIIDEFGWWWRGSLVKSIMGKQVDINKDNIDNLINSYKRNIQPHKKLMSEIYQPIVDELSLLKIHLLCVGVVQLFSKTIFFINI